jgi:hypothetical protein
MSPNIVFWGQFLPFGKIFFEKNISTKYSFTFQNNLPKLEFKKKDHHVFTHSSNK